MSATVDLGHLRLTHPQTGTRLDGSVAIATKTTGMFATDKITELSLEELLLSKTAWVCRGPGLRFTMNLLVDGSPLPSEDMTLLERNLQSADVTVFPFSDQADLVTRVTALASATSQSLDSCRE